MQRESNKKRRKTSNQKNDIDWFVKEGIIVPVVEKSNVGYTHVFQSPDKCLHEYTFLIGKYKDSIQSFLVGKRMVDSETIFEMIHWPTLEIFETPTSASNHFVSEYIAAFGPSKSKLSGYQYLRIKNPKWKGEELKMFSTLADIRMECEGRTHQEASMEEEEETTDTEIVIKEMEEGEPIQLDNDQIKLLLEETNPDKYKS